MQSLISQKARDFFLTAISSLALSNAALVSSVNAQLLDLADLPLFVGTNVPSNLIISFDDSGSMMWGYMPDSIETVDGNNVRSAAKSSTYNLIYYNPEVSYRPPLNHLGVEYDEADFTAADPDFFNVTGNGIGGASINLSTSFRVRWNPPGFGGFGRNFAIDGDGSGGTSGNDAAQSAYYYVYDAGNTDCPAGDLTDDRCYDRVTVNASSGPSRERPELDGAVSTDERTNFANWFQWYSYRMLAGKTSLSRAFGPDQISDTIRVARQTINKADDGDGGPRSGDPGANNKGANAYLSELTIQEREYFYEWLWNIDNETFTPLRIATHIAGQHFSIGSGDADSPYREVPGDSSSPEVSCRINSHVLLTDGNWNRSAPTISGWDQDEETINFPETIEGISQYNPSSTDHHIFYHGEGTDNLADVAFHYWINDLRGNLSNNVKPSYSEISESSTDGNPVYPADFWNPKNDPATWQHMRNYTIAFGTAGRVPVTEDVYEDLLDGVAFTDTEGTTGIGWRSTGDANFRTDDVYHAAINGRGEFFNSKNPEELVEAFEEIISDVGSEDGSVATITVNSGSISTDSLVYQARFSTDNWTGELAAFDVSDGSDADDPMASGCNAEILGTLCSETWNAAERTSSATVTHTTREVFAYVSAAALDADPAGAGVDFKWGMSTNLSGAQQILLNAGDGLGKERVDYLRGDDSNEGSLFRVRPLIEGTTDRSRLGPIVHSSPVYVGDGLDVNNSRQFSFPDDLEASGQTYSSFLSSIAGRPEMIYVGANDGMLHAFNASDSASGGVERFAYVPSPVFDNLHELTEPDFQSGAYVDGAIRAQDVFYGGVWRTLLVGGLRSGGQGYYALDVTTPQSATATNIVRWEFTDDNDPDMGYSYGEPLLVRANNDRWVVIVANGYNSAEADGRQGSGRATLFVLDAEDGEKLAEFTVGSNTGTNGLSGPVAVSADGDFNVDYVYAGDLEGNLWKFDMTSSNTTNWNSAALLYSATDDRPITASPTVGTHPANLGGRVIYFGTGQYIDPDDNSSTDTQRFYGIWDQDTCTGTGTACINDASLVAQTLDGPGTGRQTSDVAIDWSVRNGWYLQLSAGADSEAERVIGKATLLGGVVVFTTVIPSGDVCEGSIEGFLFAIDRNNGGTFDLQVFDTTNDGLIDTADMVTDSKVANIIKLGDFASQAVYVGADSSEKGTLYAGDDPTLIDNFGTNGRIRWRQLQ